MCFGGNSAASEADNTAQELLNRETVRQNNVQLGKTNIDNAFSQFSDPYFASYKDAYSANYTPQVDEQYKTAVAKTIAALAGRGMDRSSVGAAKQGELADKYIQAKQTVASDADTAANQLRAQVEGAKSNLYQVNTASADPAAANTMALGQAKTLVAPPTYSPIGEIFASFVEPIASYNQSRNNTATKNYASPFSTRRSATGSATVVN